MEVGAVAEPEAAARMTAMMRRNRVRRSGQLPEATVEMVKQAAAGG